MSKKVLSIYIQALIAFKSVPQPHRDDQVVGCVSHVFLYKYKFLFLFFVYSSSSSLVTLPKLVAKIARGGKFTAQIIPS